MTLSVFSAADNLETTTGIPTTAAHRIEYDVCQRNISGGSLPLSLSVLGEVVVDVLEG